MVTARVTTSATVKTEISDCNVMSSLARWVSGTVSFGLNATALVIDIYK